MNCRRHHQRAAYAWLLCAVVVTVYGLSICGVAEGQGIPPRLTAGPAYTGNGSDNGTPKFPDVDVVFALTSPDGAPIQPNPADLRLVSDGKEVGAATSLRSFEQAGYGITAILALDASGSMRGAPIQAMHESIAKFVDQARPQDKVAVLTFADQTQVDVPFGSTKEAIASELNSVRARGKFTHLYDGLLDALDLFKSDQPQRRQIVVISDGHDEGSEHAIVDVILKAKSLSVVVDSIGLTRDQGEYLANLQQLSQATGGAYRRANSGDELTALIGQGIAAERATPVAAFKTSGLPADDTLHSIQIHWLPGDLTAATFIQTPKAGGAGAGMKAILRAPEQRLRNAGNPWTNPWIWGLGLCFVAGVVLLVISLAGPKQKAVPGGVPQTAMPTSGPPPLPHIAMPVGGSPGVGMSYPSPAGKAVTRIETMPLQGAAQTGGTTKAEKIPTVPSVVAPVDDRKPGAEPVPTVASQPQRNRTQMAVFFHAPAQGPFARIEVRNGELAGKAFPMTTTTFTIGAIAANQLILSGDPKISAQHARLVWEEGILKIEDSKSTNGTFVNSNRTGTGRQLLKPGDEIRMGETVFVVKQA